MSTRYTRSLSRIVTRYIPIIALASSLYGVSKICNMVVVFVAVLPYILIAIASLTHDLPMRARLASLLLYLEVILFIGIKYDVFNIK